MRIASVRGVAGNGERKILHFRRADRGARSYEYDHGESGRGDEQGLSRGENVRRYGGRSPRTYKSRRLRTAMTAPRFAYIQTAR